MDRFGLRMQETSSDITTGAIVSHGRKKRLGLDIYSEREVENHETEECIKRKVSHEKFEALLIASHGNKVKPRLVYG